MTEINTPLLRKVLDHITAHPEEWNQGYWATRWTSCGTAYCVAGHAVVMAGHAVQWQEDFGLSSRLDDRRHIATVAQDLLGVPDDDDMGVPMFRGSNTLRDIYTLANEYTGGEIAIPDELPDGS